jgi:hypothetical protein
MNLEDILHRLFGVSDLERRANGGPADRRRRIVNALARCFVLETDRIEYDRDMVVPCRSIIPYLDPVSDPESRWWTWTYARQHPACVTPVMEVRRKEVLKRIAMGNLGIDDRLGAWNGSFWHGLKLSGAIKQGFGTELRIWKAHRELIADISEMPLMHRLEPSAPKGGQRRLRRCYAAFLPPEDPTGRSTLAGLFTGAVLRDMDGETCMELPDDDGVRGVLTDWGIPFSPLERPKGRKVVRASPLFAALVAHLMPPRSAARIIAIKNAGGCPFLSVVLWEMAVGKKNRRYMPFPDALPFGVSKSTFFRRRWRRKDLHRAGWLDLGIRITPKLRELLVEWFERKLAGRAAFVAQPMNPAQG